MADSCTVCGASPPTVTIKRCAKCSTTPYCSRDCQKADWKSHKKVCGKPSPTSSSSSPPATSSPLTRPITNPFTRLDQGTYLHDLPEQDVYTLLIDAYRLRVSDVTNFDGAAMVADEIFMDDELTPSDSFPGFRHFLNTAQFCPPTEGTEASVLPPWWSAEKRRACDLLAVGQAGEGVGTPALRAWCDLRRKAVLDKGEVSARYGSPQFPMQLRMLAEAVYQRGVGGMPGTSMRKMMASMEGGGGAGGMQGSMVDIMAGSHSRVR